MAELAAIGSIVSGIAGVAGTIMSVSGALQQGKDAEAKAKYEAKVQEQQADEAQAASQREASEKYRQGQYMLSQQRAAIAGSGGSVNDPSVIDMMGETAGETALSAETSIYKGEQQARGYNDAAKVSRYEGKAARRASYYNAAGALFSGVTSMFSRFGAPQKSAPAKSVRTPYGSYG